jgi:hypothetical protein
MGLPLSERIEKSLGSDGTANGTSGKMFWQRSVSQLIYSRSKDGRLLWRSGNH